MCFGPPTATITPMTTRHRHHRLAPGNCLVKLLIGLLILTVGFIAGGITSAIIVSNKMIETLQQPESYPDMATSLLESHYNLQPEQTEQVRAIFHQRYEQGVWLTWKMWPIIEASLDQTAAELRAVLNEEQIEQFNADYQRLRETYLKRPEKPENMPANPMQFMEPIFQRFMTAPAPAPTDTPSDPTQPAEPAEQPAPAEPSEDAESSLRPARTDRSSA